MAGALQENPDDALYHDTKNGEASKTIHCTNNLEASSLVLRHLECSIGLFNFTSLLWNRSPRSVDPSFSGC